MKKATGLILTILTLAACHHRPQIRFNQTKASHARPAPSLGYAYLMRQQRIKDGATAEASRKKIVQFATNSVGKQSIEIGGKWFRPDCSGLIRAALSFAGITVSTVGESEENDVSTLYRFVEESGQIFGEKPAPGDLVFFHHTYEIGQERGQIYPLTHVGIVEQVLNNDTIIFIHFMGDSVIRSRMNLKNPTAQIDSQTKDRVNHMLRRSINGYPGFTAAELFAGFGQLTNNLFDHN